MKKLLSLVCAIACAVILTACGEVNYTDAETERINNSISMSKEVYIPLIQTYAELSEVLSSYTAEEIAYSFENNGLFIDGNAFLAAIDNFTKAKDEIGEILELGDATATIDGKKIVVNIEVIGEKRDGTAEIIVSNDLMFVKLQSASLTTNKSFGEKMKYAGLNTAIGLVTVFAVLVIIIFVIILLGKVAGGMGKKDKKKTDGVDNAVAQIEKQEEVNGDLTSDTELVAVIAAAVAAYENNSSTDGFVVRSIIKR